MMVLNYIVLKQIDSLADHMIAHSLVPVYVHVGQNAALVLRDSLSDYFMKSDLTLDSARYRDMEIIVNPFIHKNAVFVTPDNKTTSRNVDLVREINYSVDTINFIEEE